MPATYSAKLTKEYIDKKTSAPDKGYVVHWDITTRGFGLRVSTGGKRTFIVVGRVHNRVIWYTIGRSVVGPSRTHGRKRTPC